jgi:DNA-binding protein YbaB
MTLTDDEYVAQAEAALAHWRARHAAWKDAIARIEVEPVHEAVRARFDSDGTLLELDIDPEALRDYTNTELEEIITEVLRRTRAQVHQQVFELFGKYLAPNGPGFDPDAIGEPYVTAPE